jgi:2-C-methyl-D-erythritol 4-phosphate cytidylyltransferase / 2-C-methyl-D-erythritol 2,4-cyclodiphosphate synthase
VTSNNHYPPHFGVVIPAGGIGSRIGCNRPKQFLPLAGIPILVRTCRVFLSRNDIHILVVAAPTDFYQETVDLLHTHLNQKEVTKVVFTVGGSTRQDSVRAGVDALPDEVDVVLVHDAARPLVDQATIDRCLQGAVEYGAVIAAIPVKDTLKLVGDEATIEQTVDRSALWQAQTPQAIRRDLLAQAFAQAAQKKFIGTDEASLLEAAGIPVRVVPGNERNVKITRPEDLAVAEAILAEETNMKIGHGFDAHRLVPERKLILGGVPIDFELGLDGHSDADVVAHALTDALLGALGAGDIGRHFPDSDPSYKGINSLLLLERVCCLMKEQQYRLANADLTIVCQRPRLAPFLDTMQTNLARCCKVAPPAINIKATTTEKMGYTGRGEGIAAHAVVLLRSDHGRP